MTVAGGGGHGGGAAQAPPVLGVSGILSALKTMGSKPGVTQDMCCKMMRRWGEQRKVTPQGRVIIPEDVEAAIKLWQASAPPAPAAVVPPVSPATAPSPVTATTAATDGAEASGAPAPSSTLVNGVASTAGDATAPRQQGADTCNSLGGSAAQAPPRQADATPAAAKSAPAAAARSKSKRTTSGGAAAKATTKRQRTKELQEQQPKEEEVSGAVPSSAAANGAVAANDAPPANGAPPANDAPAASTAAAADGAAAADSAVAAAGTSGAARQPARAEGAAASKPLTKRQRTKELREQQQKEEEARLAEEQRVRQERAEPFKGLSLQEMREKRMEEVLEEMSGRLRDIVVRTAKALGTEPPTEETLAKLCSGAGDAAGMADKREAYMRAIHTVREAVSMPEGLEAELMPHQVDGLEWLVSVYINGLHGILADEMGLGKTIQTIAWLQWLKEVKDNKGPHLIVAPKSTLSNWHTEFARFAPTYKAWLVVGEEEERRALAKKLGKRVKHNKTTVFITNYEQIHRNDWLQDFDWQCIVIDEGHKMKNQKSVLHETMTKMRCRTKMLLTGTPLQNNMNELWALLHYLLPDLFVTSLDFQSWFLDPLRGIDGLNEFEVQLRPQDEELLISRLHMMLSPFLLQRTKAQVMEQKLPPKVESTVRVQLSAWQRSAYEDLQKRTIKLLTAEDKVETQKVNNALMQLRKIVLHPYLFTRGHSELGPGLLKAAGKFEVLDRMLVKLLRFDHKVLIFSQFTSALDVLGAYLQWRGHKYARLDGQTPHEERRRQMASFSDPAAGLDVFLLSARAGGLGLNLQAADTVILFDLDWNPQNDKQAVARAHRYGQQKEVRVFRLLTDSAVEKHMERRTNEKLELERKIIGAGMFTKGASQEQRADMLRSILGLSEESAQAESQKAAATAGVAAEEAVTSPEELNRLLARNEEELSAFVQMDAEILRPEDGRDVSLPLLVRCGRLMSEEEVPQGFRLEDGDADEE